MVQLLKTRWTALMADRTGISSIEYAAMAVGVVVAVVAGAKALGGALSTFLGILMTTVGL
jgi:Flp pilus assembly pilin Flp